MIGKRLYLMGHVMIVQIMKSRLQKEYVVVPIVMIKYFFQMVNVKVVNYLLVLWMTE